MSNAPNISEWDGYRDNAVYVTEETPVGDIVDFMKNSIQNPTEHDGIYVWNFSNHKLKPHAIDWEDLNHDRYIVPFNVTGVWGFMFSLLPDEIRSAEMLVYFAEQNHYKALTNFYRTTPAEQVDEVRYDLSMRMKDVLESETDL